MFIDVHVFLCFPTTHNTDTTTFFTIIPQSHVFVYLVLLRVTSQQHMEC